MANATMPANWSALPLNAKVDWLREHGADLAPMDKLSAWNEINGALAEIKSLEADLRRSVVDDFVPAPKEGVNNVDLGDGYTLKITHKLNYSLADNDSVNAALDKIAKSGNEGAFIAERLCSWTPRLSVSEYKDLSDDYRKIIDEVVTVKPAMPAVTIAAPKKK